MIKGGAFVNIYNIMAFKKIWLAWKKFAHAFGRFQTKVILTLFYGLIFVPFALVIRLFKKQTVPKSFWVEREKKNFDIADFEHPF